MKIFYETFEQPPPVLLIRSMTKHQTSLLQHCNQTLLSNFIASAPSSGWRKSWYLPPFPLSEKSPFCPNALYFSSSSKKSSTFLVSQEIEIAFFPGRRRVPVMRKPPPTSLVLSFLFSPSLSLLPSYILLALSKNGLSNKAGAVLNSHGFFIFQKV